MSTANPWKALPVALAVLLFACSGSHCQSGPKYGTQCYSENEIPESHEAERDGAPRDDPGAKLTTNTPHRR